MVFFHSYQPPIPLSCSVFVCMHSELQAHCTVKFLPKYQAEDIQKESPITILASTMVKSTFFSLAATVLVPVYLRP